MSKRLLTPFTPRNLANAASLLWHAYKSLPTPSREVNWAGMNTTTPVPYPTSVFLPILSPDGPDNLSLPTTRPQPLKRLYTHTHTHLGTHTHPPPLGFYVLDPSSPPSHPSLILGPFQGKVACQTIAFGRGVCGTAAASRKTQLVPDVDAFPGHIACDGASRSEIVVPITVDVLSPEESVHVEKKVVGIIDIDCAAVDGFDETDRRYLEELAGLLGRACDW